MKLSFRHKYVVIVLLLLLFYYLYYKIIVESTIKVPKYNVVNKFNNLSSSDSIMYKHSEKIFIAVVSCGDRVQETLNMLKSAIMFSKHKLHFVVFSDEHSFLDFKEKLSEWKTLTKNIFDFDVLPLTFPKNNEEEWRKLFKPCAAQRLFLPSVLTNVDSVLYVDTDTLFLTPVENIWEHFHKMNSSQIAALAPEHEDPNVGWYNRFARHPYYGTFGVNSGVMLMNLTRMRNFKWTEYVIPIYKKYKLNITWGDQDIINIIFHYHPDKLYIYSCRYNYRPDHCMYMSICNSAEKEGVAVIHGSRGFFHSTKQPSFQAIYHSFEEYQIGTDLHTNFYLPLESYLDLTTDTNCGRIKDIFLKNIQKYIPSAEER